MDFAKMLKKCYHFKLKFFQISSIFPGFVVSFLRIQQTKNSLNYKVLLSHFFPISKVSRHRLWLQAETLETETCKNRRPSLKTPHCVLCMLTLLQKLN